MFSHVRKLSWAASTDQPGPSASRVTLSAVSGEVFISGCSKSSWCNFTSAKSAARRPPCPSEQASVSHSATDRRVAPNTPKKLSLLVGELTLGEGGGTILWASSISCNGWHHCQFSSVAVGHTGRRPCIEQTPHTLESFWSSPELCERVSVNLSLSEDARSCDTLSLVSLASGLGISISFGIQALRCCEPSYSPGKPSDLLLSVANPGTGTAHDQSPNPAPWTTTELPLSLAIISAGLSLAVISCHLGLMSVYKINVTKA